MNNGKLTFVKPNIGQYKFSIGYLTRENIHLERKRDIGLWKRKLDNEKLTLDTGKYI